MDLNGVNAEYYHFACSDQLVAFDKPRRLKSDGHFDGVLSTEHVPEAVKRV